MLCLISFVRKVSLASFPQKRTSVYLDFASRSDPMLFHASEVSPKTKHWAIYTALCCKGNVLGLFASPDKNICCADGVVDFLRSERATGVEPATSSLGIFYLNQYFPLQKQNVIAYSRS
jgi:hypothetical protein